MRTHRASRLFFALLILCAAASAQNFNYVMQREQISSLDGKWRFHAGDDPRWADPKFDDSHWSLLQDGEEWGKQGYKGYGGVGWYRFHVHALPKEPLALLLQKIMDSYQVFANGQLLGGIGKLPPHPESRGRFRAAYAIPSDLRGHDLTIAIRVWRAPLFARYFGGGPNGKGARLGEPGLITSRLREYTIEAGWSRFDLLIISILETLAGITALSLYFLGRSEREYLWFALVQLTLAFGGWYLLYITFAQNSEWMGFLAIAVDYSSRIFEILFFANIFRSRRSWFYWMALSAVVLNAVQQELFFSIYVPLALGDTLAALSDIIFYSWILWATWQGVRQRLLDARLLFIPVLFYCLISLIANTLADLPAFGLPTPGFLFPLTAGFNLGYLHLMPQRITEFFVLLAILAVLIARFARTRREEEQYARELDAARNVQQVLVPTQLPVVPSFSIASVYEPVQQVGGDFFQILPAKDGVLIVIGDVSGKGLPAAMTVSLVVGALRVLAIRTTSPAAILQGLNRRLVGRGTGFTTCLIAYLQRDGRVVLANAGHLPPYRNGEEIEIIAELPLGVTTEANYAESALLLQPDDTLTFVTDGVVEARNSRGELFGFEQTREKSTISADALAQAAKQFGQEDDITVLKVAFRPIALAV